MGILMEEARTNYITQAVRGCGSWTALIEAMCKDNSLSWLGVETDGSEILCSDEETAELIADIIEEFDDTDYAHTGYYDPVEDAQDGICDRYTGKYYVDID